MAPESASVSRSAAENPSKFRIVGIGASAGGLESLEQFFANLPPNPGMAFVVVQHLSPDFRSVMDELLSRHCDIPVQQAEDNVEVQPNHVYLLPPRKEMIIRDRHLLLNDKERTHALTLPIDQFFRSLAEDLGPDAIAIILSGSGSDGSRGVRDVKRAGGHVYVESPESAKFDGMPLSALATGVVDESAAAGELPLLLNQPEPAPATADADVVSAAGVMRSTVAKPEAKGKARHIVERQSRHMARLLDDLLDVSRITRGGIELRKEDLDLREVIRIAVESLSLVLLERQSELHMELPGDVLPIRGDAARIQQVVVNLLSNAARYSAPGSPIYLSAAVEGESVVLRVKDQGRGISPSMLSAIFELFVQDGQGIERSMGGLGIGLTLVRQIVELHGGMVKAISEGVGKGSEFVVRLPRQPHAVIHRIGQARPKMDKRRILVVEDQDDARVMMRLILESMGHIVIEEADGASAVKTIEHEHPDIALIDIGLPNMSGYEVAHKIREQASLDDVILVALTGYGRAVDIQEAKAAGFDAHVTKPADVNVLEEILANRLQRWKAS